MRMTSAKLIQSREYRIEQKPPAWVYIYIAIFYNKLFLFKKR